MKKYFFQKVVTEKTIAAYKRKGETSRNSCRCYLCGHAFKVGEIMSLANGNSTPDKRSLHNFLVCEACDGEDVLDRWIEHCKEGVKKYWWMSSYIDPDRYD